MELRHLRYFVAVAEELHFGRAALRLRISQPPLSQQIRGLEDMLHTSLLLRTKRSVQLTEAGRIFLEEARATLGQADRAVQLAQRAGRGEIGHLSVGFVPWAEHTYLPRIIQTFSDRYAEVELQLHSLASDEQASALCDGRIHIGIAIPPIERGTLVAETFFSDPLVVAFPEGHRFASAEEVLWQELAFEPYIAFERERARRYNAFVTQACRDAGVALRVRHEADHPHAILALVGAGLGISLLPASVTRDTRPGIAYRRLRPAGPDLKTIIVRARDHESPLVRSFLAVINEVREERSLSDCDR